MTTESHSIKVTPPTQLRITAPDGQTLLTIHADGRWEFRDDAAPTEAARVFVREVHSMVGGDAMVGLTEDEFREHIASATRQGIALALEQVSGFCADLKRAGGAS